MRRSRKICSKNLGAVVGAMLVLAGLTVLVGCQGVSAGGNSSTQQQTGSLSLGASTLDFGSVTAGSSKALTVTATNSETQSVTITSVAISTKYFTLTGPSLPVVIAAGQSVSLGVNFIPNAAGAFSATVSISSDASNTIPSLSLSGTGVSDGQMTLNPSSQALPGSVTVGTKQSQNVTLTNTGATNVNISQASISGAGFQLSGITAPISLNASQSVTFTVAFAPETTGSSTGTVTIVSDASNSTLTMGLSGTGVSLGALGSNPTSLAFGSVTVGSNQTLSETVSNTGGSAVTISQVGVSGTGFTLSGITTPLTLAAGQSANFSVSFAPQSATAVSGSVTVTSTATNPTLTIALSGTGTSEVGQLTVAPTTLALGSVVVGTSGTASGNLTASGANVTVTAASTNNSVFTVGGLSLPVTIPAGKSVPFTVTFSPTTSGAASASLTFTSNAQPSTTIEALNGTGTSAVGQLTVAPTTLAVGSVVVGTSGTASGSLTASGANVTVTAASTNNSVFSVGGLSLPVTIPAGKGVPFTVTFSPTTSGTASASLTFTSNAQPSTTIEALTGTGTPAPTHTVNLSWNASTSSNISGYNVYRAVYVTSCGSYGKINSVLNTSTIYTDSSVSDGVSYCYAATAVNSSDEESSYSNIVTNV